VRGAALLGAGPALALLLGCAGSPGSPGLREEGTSPTTGGDRPGHAAACRPEHRGQASDSACASDADCGVCHDGSDCGVPLSRAEIETLGAGCARDDAADCEPTTPRCCEGRCVTAGWMYVEP
jgi:hypothetical protein